MASQIFEPSFTPVSIVDIIYPIGSIYMNISDINPSNVFSGTSWERISDKFLAASGSTFNLGDTGGSSSKTVTASGTISGHELTIQEIPSHNHQLGSHSHDSGTYVVAESGSHKHNIRGWMGYNVIDPRGQKHCNTRTYGTDATSTNPANRSAGSHSHTVSGTSGVSSVNTTSVGDGEAHNHNFSGTATSVDTLPPYLAVYMWKRTA